MLCSLLFVFDDSWRIDYCRSDEVRILPIRRKYNERWIMDDSKRIVFACKCNKESKEMRQLQAEYYIYESLLIIRQLLTKGNTMEKQPKNTSATFRLPTKKEQAKHRKLIKKQRQAKSRVSA
jgi:hypothetical protein